MMSTLRALVTAAVIAASLACAGSGGRPSPEGCYATLHVRNDTRRVVNLRSGIWREGRLTRWLDSPGETEICLKEHHLQSNFLIVWVEDRMLGPHHSDYERWYLLSDTPYIEEGTYWELTLGYGVTFWGTYLWTGRQ